VVSTNNISKEFRFICTRCGNCCTDKTTIVNVTYSDILRIKNGLKLSVDELLEILGFYKYQEKIDGNFLKKMIVPPIETERGLAFMALLKKNAGSCIFYDVKNKKCLIYGLRPNFCRTFPFSFKLKQNKDDRSKAKIIMSYTEKGKKYCPGINPESPLIDDDKWIKLGMNVLMDLNNNTIFIEKWNGAVKKGIINPTARNLLLNILKLKKTN
jgi:Fe-S-cluster containining protein